MVKSCLVYAVLISYIRKQLEEVWLYDLSIRSSVRPLDAREKKIKENNRTEQNRTEQIEKMLVDAE